MTTSRLYPAYPFLSASVAVFRAGKVLVASRTQPPNVGAYSLPGGLVEVGERMEEAALRELWEEVQVKARIIGFNQHIQTYACDTKGRVSHHFVIANYAAEWLEGEGTPGPEAGDVMWTDEAALANLTVTPGLIPLIASARLMLNK